MLVFPKLNKIKQHTVSLTEFAGLDKRANAAANSLSETVGISSKNFPRLTTRKGRQVVFSAPADEQITGIFAYDKAFVTTAWQGRTRLYYGEDFSSLSCIYTSDPDDMVSSMFCFFADKVCLFNLKTALDSQGLMTSSINAIDMPGRYSAPVFNDITVYNNRILGCRKKQVYASAVREAGNWDSEEKREDFENGAFFKRIEAKSDFTSCTTYKNHALFFTEDEVFELCGSDTQSYDLEKIADLGCVNRFAISEVGGVLYFLSKQGIVQYNGNSLSLLPNVIGDVSIDHSKAAFGGDGTTLYARMCTEQGDLLYTYDTQGKMWAKEGNFDGVCSVFFNGKVIFANPNCIYALDVDFLKHPKQNDGKQFPWEFATQDIHTEVGNKRIGLKLYVDMETQEETRVEVWLCYDDRDFVPLGEYTVCGQQKICISIPNRKYNNVRFSLSGKGEARINGISYKYSEGGE